jgi:hypothetical protein
MITKKKIYQRTRNWRRTRNGEPEMEPEMGLGDEAGEDGLSGLEDSQEVTPEMGLETGMDSMELGGDDMDMTAASDDDVIAIYKN